MIHWYFPFTHTMILSSKCCIFFCSFALKIYGRCGDVAGKSLALFAETFSTRSRIHHLYFQPIYAPRIWTDENISLYSSLLFHFHDSKIPTLDLSIFAVPLSTVHDQWSLEVNFWSFIVPVLYDGYIILFFLKSRDRFTVQCPIRCILIIKKFKLFCVSSITSFKFQNQPLYYINMLHYWNHFKFLIKTSSTLHEYIEWLFVIHSSQPDGNSI